MGLKNCLERYAEPGIARSKWGWGGVKYGEGTWEELTRHQENSHIKVLPKIQVPKGCSYSVQFSGLSPPINLKT